MRQGCPHYLSLVDLHPASINVEQPYTEELGMEKNENQNQCCILSATDSCTATFSVCCFLHEDISNAWAETCHQLRRGILIVVTSMPGQVVEFKTPVVSPQFVHNLQCSRTMLV